MELPGVRWPLNPVPNYLAEEDPLTDYCPGLAANIVYTAIDQKNEVPGAEKNRELEFALRQDPSHQVQKEKIVKEPIILSEEGAKKEKRAPKQKGTAQKSEVKKKKRRKGRSLFDL